LSAAATEVRLVVFDWAGTTVDHGCFAPVAGFVRTFARHGVEVTAYQARGPMGLQKRDHLLAMLRNPEVARRWRDTHGRDWTEADVERLYQDFVPLQMEVLDEHSRLVPGLPDCVAELRRRGILIGGTTGYFHEAAERVYRLAERQGFVPDSNMCAEDVPEGRPAPWMMFRVMEALRVYPGAAVVKVGDTVPDIGEGLNAGVWSVGVTGSGSEVGCSAEELAALPHEERRTRLAAARRMLLDAGAHAVIDSLAELPPLIDAISERLRRNEPRPSGGAP
jgi:phosphonoacetaldehyde hydrolase